MSTKLKKVLRVSGIVIFALGCLGLIMQVLADIEGYQTNYLGVVIIIVLGISMYGAAGPKEKQITSEDVAEKKDVQVKRSLSFSGFIQFLSSLFKNHVEPLFDKLSDNIDWPLQLSSVSFFAKHKFIALVTGVFGGLIWLCLIPILAISTLLAIIPCLIISAILYLFRVQEKVTFRFLLWIVAIISAVIIIILITDCPYLY